ncbi:hypothetical protein KOI40_00120 [Aestuariicella sp. G3-2]|uniref:hypothetical protein n=1 Tax=Pseudomaricurvus albidus TaxID=2842452 RepID=UPI001C0C9002|nr:hypothetical protein [Aestuariicella albida]MBU3068219.1 hypothetical protein [Aestuariicella albida]
MSQPWLSRKEWSSPTIDSHMKSGRWVMWVFALIFGGVSSVVLIAGHDELSRKLARGDYLVLLVLLFPLVSVFLLAQAIKLTREWRRYGATPFHMDPYPGAIGGQMGGYVDLGIPQQDAGEFEAALVLFRRTRRRSGNETKTTDSVVWQRKVPLHTEACRVQNAERGTRVRVLVDVPEGLQASQVPDNDYHYWRLSIKALDKKVAFQRSWELPMFPSQAKASRPLPAEAHAAFEDRQLSELEHLTEITQRPDGLWLRFTPGNTRKLHLIMTFMGAIFFSIGAGMTQVSDAMAWIFVLAFGGFGVLMLSLGIYGLGKELRVRITPNTVLTKRSWFGMALSTSELARSDVEGLSIHSSSSMSSGEEVVQYYKLKLRLKSGSEKALGFGIDGFGKAEKLAEHLSLLTGLPYRGLN